MYSLDTCTQLALYEAHKSWTFGSERLKIEIPDFNNIDTKVSTGKRSSSLQDVCFELESKDGNNLFVDIDNATRSGNGVPS